MRSRSSRGRRRKEQSAGVREVKDMVVIELGASMAMT